MDNWRNNPTPLVIYLILGSNAYQCTDNKGGIVVTTACGKIKGTTEITVGEKKTCYTFRGIPYAKPPVGDMRFEPPVKDDGWNCILDATKEAPLCTQMTSDAVAGQEDCLYLNVYTTNPSKRSNLPVMVWLHGGAFIEGNTTYSAYGPDYLLEQGIVFVSVNYRLGIFGFLSTQDLSAPGNTGLKDQVLALEWVKKNIQYFGGDPKKVTIAGQAAGAACVSYLMLSPLSKGLFRSAIMESGSSLGLWSFSRTSVRLAHHIAREVNVDASNSRTLVQGLKLVDAKLLQKSASELNGKMFIENPFAGFSIAPVLEPEHKGAFLSKKMHGLFKNGAYHKVPIIIGFNSNETITRDYKGIEVVKELFQKVFVENGTVLTPADLTSSPVKRYKVGVLIKENILKPGVSFNQFMKDDQFLRPIREQYIQCSKYSPVYAYQFSYEGVLSGIRVRLDPGVGLGEELSYLFRRERDYFVPENDKLVRARILKMWTNFVKEYTPTPISDSLLQGISWTSNCTRGACVYLDINQNLTIRQNLDQPAQEFYDHIYSQFGDPPYNTY